MVSNTAAIFSISFLVCVVFSFTVSAQTEDEIGITQTIPRIENDELAKAVNSLGYNIMMKMMNNNDDKNIVISPTGIGGWIGLEYHSAAGVDKVSDTSSLEGLLAMTLLGSVGRTYDELAGALGFSEDIRVNRENHETLGDLFKNLNTNESSSKTMYADALFVDAESRLRDLYRSFISRVYNGEAKSVDFADRNTVKMSINQWVNNNTNGKIPDFLKEPLPADSKAVLLSALYFSGQWENPFLQEFTMKMPFKKSKDDVIMADLMLNLGNFKYIYSTDDNVQMIALPYNDSETVLYALKPRKPDIQTLPELINQLNYQKIHNLIDQLRIEKCVIRFPKMDLKFSANLEDPLKALGIQSMFSPGQANFALMIDGNVKNQTEDEIVTKISDGNISEIKNLKDIVDNLPNPGIHVDSIIHDVRIKIDEYGTEAVAATSGILARTANTFYTDTPFYMFIRNEKTKLVTFSAFIFNPNEQD